MLGLAFVLSLVAIGFHIAKEAPIFYKFADVAHGVETPWPWRCS